MGDEFFDDDDLDPPDTTLLELEHHAFSSTQLPAAANPTRLSQKRPNTAIGAPRAPHVNRNPAWRPPQPRPHLVPAQQSAPPASAPEPPSSDYGLDDEDVIDLDEQSTNIRPTPVLQPKANVPLRPAAANVTRYSSKAVLDPETEAAFAAADAELNSHGTDQWAHAPHLAPRADDGMDVTSLQARIAELEAEQARLRRAEEEARNAALAKQGEISIVRANQAKATKEFERRMAVMQKLHADESARQKAELEAGRKEREKMVTDNRFLQHDLAQEAEKAKRLTGPGKARAAASSKETPRKAKRMNLGDGFEDDEVRVVSPTKSRDKAKDQTPKHGAKRKRAAPDSPVAALSFTQPAGPSRQASNEQPVATADQSQVEVRLAEDDRFKFMQRLLNHCPYHGHERTVEALAKHSLPSLGHRSLSALLMDELAKPGNSEDPEYLPLKLARAALKLWTQCLEVNYFAAMYLIYDLIRFALYNELSPTVTQLIEEALPLCIRTVTLVAFPLFQASTKPTFAATFERTAHAKLAEEIDADEVLGFMLRLCRAAALTNRIDVFWQLMDTQCTLLMLNKAQPISQIITTLQILRTSTLATSFGPICGGAERQPQQETGFVDRITVLLFEVPEVPKNEPAYTEEEIAELRIAILEVIRDMCLADHGGLLLTQHRSAIGRLIRFLDGQINKLYTLQPLFGDVRVDEHAQPSAHELVVQTVNITLRLVYHLLRTYDSTIDLNQKLSAVKGGYHKFLISMTRIAFSEQLVFEHGIEDEVVEAAHTILDNMLTLEEGEAIKRAVETPRGTKGSDLSRAETTEKGTSAAATEVDGDTTMSDPG